MFLVCDFHIHSKYSRATSKEMNLESLDIWAKKKGIDVIGCGDFTHPLWFKELKTKLVPAEPGLFKLKTDSKTRFILTAEISSIYSKGGKMRRVHNLVFMPSFEAVEKFNAQLSWSGNLVSDGRPILGLDSKEVLKIALNSSEDMLFVPAHAWTPWFSIFGSMSGFDSIEECFDEYANYIYAIETGLSSDPAMNWRWSKLDKITLISNSDSHSPERIGREANVFDCELDYYQIIKAIKERDIKKFLFTVEFFPEEGKYHYDGHRLCGVCFSPQESKKYNNICPKCKRPLTLGVMHRLDQLADNEMGRKPEGAIPFKNLVSLDKIIAESLRKTISAKVVKNIYEDAVRKFDNEFNILLNVNLKDIVDALGAEIAEGIKRVREGRLFIKPGYDGEYGKIKIFGDLEQNISQIQKTLF